MTLKIRYKIFLAIVATSVFSVIALQSLAQYKFEQGLQRYSDDNFLDRLDPLSQFLAARYADTGSWDFIRGRKRFHSQRINNNKTRIGMSNNNPQAIRFDRGLIPRSGADIISLLDADSNWVAGAQQVRGSATKTITLDNKTIGFLALNPRGRLTRNLDHRFAKQQRNYRLVTSLAIILGALLSAFLIARNLGRPIKNLNEQVQNMSDGNYDTQLPIGRGDELGSLAKNFNKLADTLRNNRDQRRQWISDISHELRTPVSVLRAEMECIEDGLQPLDMNSIHNLRSEVERLNILIDDLHQLSQSDAGALTLNSFNNDFVKEIIDTLMNYQEQFQQKQIDVTTELDNLPEIYCDPFRLRQVISNLIQNTLRYTDSPGKFQVTGNVVDKQLILVFEDSSPGVPEQSINKIFDRLYRVDSSRSRQSNATGLGLSICASIIEAHHGTISAHSSSLGGLAIRIKLPINKIEAV